MPQKNLKISTKNEEKRLPTQIFSYLLYDNLHIPTENFHISVTELGVNPYIFTT